MTDSTEAALPRQTGQEQSTRACPNCGKALAIVERPGGSQTTENCTTCYPAAPVEERTTAAAQLPRMTGTLQGTETPVTPAVAAPTELKEQ